MILTFYFQEVVLKNGPYTRLIPDLKGVDPDDAFSIVPYEKGFTLLFYLETLLGGPGNDGGEGDWKSVQSFIFTTSLQKCSHNKFT